MYDLINKLKSQCAPCTCALHVYRRIVDEGSSCKPIFTKIINIGCT